MLSLPVTPACAERIQRGYPWVNARDLQAKFPHAKPGSLVQLIAGDQIQAIGYYNPLTQLACRILTLDPNTLINEDFFLQKFKLALSFRERNFATPFYRLIHAESDGFPGLIIDRFDNTFVCQTNTAGMENLRPLWFSALQTLFSPQRVIFRDDVPLRAKEGLALTLSAPIGSLEGLITIEENNMTFYADPNNGQKTGWFYDQRKNRHWISERARNKTVLDLYTYTGGFGICAAGHSAQHVTLVDRSESALSLAEQSAKTHDLLPKCTFIQDNVFSLLPRLIEQKQQYDLVIADPPAFVKQAQHKGPGLMGYQKLAKLAAQLVAPQGMLVIASCSHHASSADFRQAVENGLSKVNPAFKLLRKAGASPDHPIHPLLPQTHYLKSLVYRFD